MSFNPNATPACHLTDIACHINHFENTAKKIVNTKVNNQVHNITQKGKQHQDAIVKTISDKVQAVAQPILDPLVQHETDIATKRAHGDLTDQIKENLPLIALGGAAIIIILLVAKVKI